MYEVLAKEMIKEKIRDCLILVSDLGGELDVEISDNDESEVEESFMYSQDNMYWCRDCSFRYSEFIDFA